MSGAWRQKVFIFAHEEQVMAPICLDLAHQGCWDLIIATDKPAGLEALVKQLIKKYPHLSIQTTRFLPGKDVVGELLRLYQPFVVLVLSTDPQYQPRRYCRGMHSFQDALYRYFRRSQSH